MGSERARGTTSGRKAQLRALLRAAFRGARLVPLAAAAAATLRCVPVAPHEAIGETPPPPTLPSGPVSFELSSVDDNAVSAPALRGKPAVLAFVVSDTLAGQAQASILASLAQKLSERARFVVVAVEPEERHELVQGFVRFFTDKSHAPLLGAMADKDMLLGQGPFGDVRTLTVVVLDAGGRVVLRRSGVTQAADIAAALAGSSGEASR